MQKKIFFCLSLGLSLMFCLSLPAGASSTWQSKQEIASQRQATRQRVSSYHPVTYQRQTTRQQVPAYHPARSVRQKQTQTNPALRIGIREGRAKVSLISSQGLGVYRGQALWRKVRANTPLTISLAGTNLAIGKSISTEPLSVRPLSPGGTVKLTDGYTYRGAIEVLKTPGRWGLTVVNVIPIEDYLYGVVGKEMPPAWSQEALKAQAVAARTYAVAHKSNFQQRGFDLTDDTQSQVYAGKNGEYPSVIQAVNATRGEVLTYQGRPIEALFCASAGGWTEDSEKVWGRYLPYLRAVPDDSRAMPRYTWQVTTTPEQMAAKLNAAGKGVGQIKSLTLSPLDRRPLTANDRSTSGRVQSLVVNGTRRSLVVKGTAFQSIFGLKSTLFDFYQGWGAVPDIDREKNKRQTTIPLKRGQKLIIFGLGWGHGLGLSQYGAYQMARRHPQENDYYRTILTHYYTGAKIEKLY